MHPGEHVHFSGIFSSLTLPSDGSEGDIGGEEEEETNKGKQRNDQSGQVEASFSRGGVGRGRIGNLWGTVTFFGGRVSRSLWGSILLISPHPSCLGTSTH